MKSCLQVIENEIRYSVSNLETAVGKAVPYSDDINKVLFEKFLDKLSNSDGQPLSQLWDETLRNINNSGVYEESDLAVFKNFGNVLGCGDIETQTKNIDLFNTQLTAQLESANENLKNKGHILGKLGIYAGLLTVIILW